MSKRLSFIPNLHKDNDVISSNKEKANEFMNTLSKSFTADNGVNGAIPGNCYCDPTDICPDFTPKSVNKYLKLVNPASAADPDGWPGKFWHTLHASLAYPLAIIFRKLFNSGKLPANWKRSNITPIFKKGDPAVSSNYRPIALTSVMCKCMESMILDALLVHLTLKNLINPEQHGS